MVRRNGGRFGAGWLLLGAGALALAASTSNAMAQGAPPGKTVLGVACGQVHQLGIDKQLNMRASTIMVGCGLAPAGLAGNPSATAKPPSASAVSLPGNVDTVTGVENYPSVTQSESMAWSSDGNTVVVNMNDSRTASTDGNYSGVSVSNDGGTTFTRLNPSPFATGHGENFGDPIVVYNRRLGKWFAGDLAAGGDCGGQGIGLWTSYDGTSWSVGSCAHVGNGDDRESMWVDNNPTSSHYGRMYVSFNDFTTANANLTVQYSDNGTSWTSVTVFSTFFMRDVQLTGGPDGTVFIGGMDEGGGGFATRQNHMFHSTDGGGTWTDVTMGARFAAAGDTGSCSSGYFVAINPIWRHMGWGQPGVGPAGVVHYVYAGAGVNSGDTGDIYYTRSTDNGSTWSTPIVLNTDKASGGNKTQWMPSLSVTQTGDVLVHWYDRRDTTDGQNYKVYARESRNNGLTWLRDDPISTVLIPQPLQPDPAVQSCYAGDYMYDSVAGNKHLTTWTDGRNLVADTSGNLVSQQDVYFASVPSQPTVCCKDFSGDHKADIIFRNDRGANTGKVAVWLLNGTAISSGGFPGQPSTSWTVVGLGDFNGDGKADILWQDDKGDLYGWLMNGTAIASQGAITPSAMMAGAVGSKWHVVGVGDFNGDGKADILWRDQTGALYLWTMNGLNVTSQTLIGSAPLDWTVAGVGDFDGDGKTDILWQQTDGWLRMWFMNGANVKSTAAVFQLNLAFQVAGIGDADGDGKADIIFRAPDATTNTFVYLMNGAAIKNSGVVGAPSEVWQIYGIGDADGDGKADIIWRNSSTGQVAVWELNGITLKTAGIPGTASLDWQIE